VEWKYQSETVVVETERAVVRVVFPVGSRDLLPDLAAVQEDRTAGSRNLLLVPADRTEERIAPGTAEEVVVAAVRRTAAVLPVAPAGKPAGLSSHKEFLPTEHIPAAVEEHKLTEEPLEPGADTSAAGTEAAGEVEPVAVETETVPSVAA
jgi:hypothetical protein